MDASVYFLIKIFGLLILYNIILGICIKWYKKWKKWCRRRELERFETFIRDQVISTFHQQRQGEDDDRFAVLMVANETSLGQLSKMRFERAKVSKLFFKDPLYDPSLPSYPVQIHLINYIVARADDTVHPESILLERFDELLEAYLHHHKKNANCVLLYSWKLPCTSCVDKIIKTLGDRNNTIHVKIVYTTESDVSAINKLRNHKFDVMEIPYNRLPHNTQQCCIQ